MPESAVKKYLAIVHFRTDTPLTELGRRVPAIQLKISELSKGDNEQAFRSTDGLLFGTFFKSALPIQIIGTELDKMTVSGDKFQFFEIGEFGMGRGFGRAAAWLQHH